jgi:energy-converting hydrogenase Eha subunit F
MDAHRARSRFVARFFAVMLAVVAVFVFLVGIHYLLGW